MSEYAIEIAGFTKKYRRDAAAVDNIDLSVKSGSFFGFIGPNGAGKTTTVHYIAGLIRKTEGSLKMFGEDAGGDNQDYKGKTGFVLEKPFYIDKLTAKEYLSFIGRMYGIEKETAFARTEELLNFFQLDNGKKHIENFSAGMKKKVSLAAALINDPQLLILDEPFEGIDPPAARQIKDQLLLMVKKGRTVFLTSHILDIVEALCGEVAIINKGRIAFQGDTEGIRERLKDRASGEKYAGLEDLFLTLVSEEKEASGLSWL